MKRITKEQYRDSARTASIAEVEPRPNKEMKIPLTVIASAATWQPKRSGARRSQSVPKDALIVTDCFAEPVPNEVGGLAMTALFGRLCASTHFQFLIFNSQLDLDKAEEAENPLSKSRHN